MAQHWIAITITGFALGGLLFLGLWVLYGRYILSGSPKGQSLRRRAFPLAFWRRRSSSTDKIDYELIARDRDIEDRRVE